MADVVEIVVVGILCDPSVEVRPSQYVLWLSSEKVAIPKVTGPYHGILFILDGLDSNLRQEIIVQHIRGEMRLDW